MKQEDLEFLSRKADRLADPFISQSASRASLTDFAGEVAELLQSLVASRLESVEALSEVEEGKLIVTEQGGVFERKSGYWTELGTEQDMENLDISLPANVLWFLDS